MQGDFARISFDASNAFTRVLAQQGRMLVEADLNEQTAIHIHYLRQLIVDTIGQCWRAGNGFVLSPGATASDFAIAAGRVYVDGIMCELAAATSYAGQPFGPVPGFAAGGAALPAAFLAYLEVHERHVCDVQMPALREVALMGRDTSTRAQVAWQIRLLTKDQVTAVQTQFAALARVRKAKPGPFTYAEGQLDDFAKALAANAQQLADLLGGSRLNPKACIAARQFFGSWNQIGALMRARARFDSRNLDPCAIPADAQFRSRENQLYRVEIHQGGIAGQATFKWSRENASVVFGLLSVQAGQGGTVTVMIDTLGRDRRSGLCEGDWVELTSDLFEFGEIVAPLGQVTAIDRGKRMVTLQVSNKAGIDLTGCTLLRRWDQTLASAPNLGDDGTVPVEESSEGRWTPLERGVAIQFVPGGLYRKGDYWLIPARVETNDIIWPQAAGNPAALPPTGIERHRGVLGFGASNNNDGLNFTDCICTVNPQCPN